MSYNSHYSIREPSPDCTAHHVQAKLSGKRKPHNKDGSNTGDASTGRAQGTVLRVEGHTEPSPVFATVFSLRTEHINQLLPMKFNSQFVCSPAFVISVRYIGPGSQQICRGMRRVPKNGIKQGSPNSSEAWALQGNPARKNSISAGLSDCAETRNQWFSSGPSAAYAEFGKPLLVSFSNSSSCNSACLSVLGTARSTPSNADAASSPTGITAPRCQRE